MTVEKQNIRLLFVDDNEDIHDDMLRIFENKEKNEELTKLENILFDDVESNDQIPDQYEFELEFASQGEIGLEKVKQALAENKPYPVVFLDIRMPPGWDGILTAHKIWEVDPNVEIVFCSAYSDYGLKDIYKELEKKDTFLFIKKPFDPIEITQAAISLSQKWFYKKKLENKIERAQEQLLQADKMASIGQLAAGVAHEINNPVGYISSNINTLGNYVSDMLSLINAYLDAENSLDTSSDLYKHIQCLKEKADLEFIQEDSFNLIKESEEGVSRVKKIVQDLKDFSHQGEKEFTIYNLNEGIETTLNIVNNEIKYKADIKKKLGDIPQIDAVGSQINQVILNLLVNASHAIEDKGTITIESFEHNNMVAFRITDTGKGIEEDKINKIFDPFFTTKPIGKGTGLGLSLSYGIVQNHNGKIQVESEIGQGTSFTVWLPIKAANLEQKAS